MTKFYVKTNLDTKTTEPEVEVYLEKSTGYPYAVTMKIKDSNGVLQNLLTITNKGMLVRHSIQPIHAEILGIETDRYDKILIDD